MTILYLLLPLSLLFVLVIGVSLWWAVFSGQYDDTDNAGAAILRDDDGGQASRD
ncbi:cbb3-type cytochrome oxidase assembly protein CcoS [Achromobacter xylosoxidans]